MPCQKATSSLSIILPIVRPLIAYTAKTLVLNMQHQAGVKLAVLIFGVGLTPLGVNTKSKIARFGTFFCRSK